MSLLSSFAYRRLTSQVMILFLALALTLTLLLLLSPSLIVLSSPFSLPSFPLLLLLLPLPPSPPLSPPDPVVAFTIMAANHASSSGSAQARSRPVSMTSDILLNPSAPVVITNEIKSTMRPRRMLNQYEFEHKVGRGQHGEVYLAMDSRDSTRVVSGTSLFFLCRFSLHNQMYRARHSFFFSSPLPHV